MAQCELKLEISPRRSGVPTAAIREGEVVVVGTDVLVEVVLVERFKRAVATSQILVGSKVFCHNNAKAK